MLAGGGGAGQLFNTSSNSQNGFGGDGGLGGGGGSVGFCMPPAATVFTAVAVTGVAANVAVAPGSRRIGAPGAGGGGFAAILWTEGY